MREKPWARARGTAGRDLGVDQKNPLLIDAQGPRIAVWFLEEQHASAAQRIQAQPTTHEAQKQPSTGYKEEGS
jgi:hypothetical protein